MDPKLALYLSFLFILWLFRQERKRHPRVSGALWVPLVWFTIVGSRPLSMWFGLEGVEDPTEGSPFDRLIFLGLIVAGLVILARRGVRWTEVRSSNKWLFLFFLYLGLSVIWSDYPLVSLKRWIKDTGNIVMVLVILGEDEPEEAIKALFERCSYALIPLSVVFIKYFPDLGRTYNRWSGEAFAIGVTTDKNTLGMSVLVCTVGMLWSMMEWQKGKAILREKMQVLAQVMPLMLAVWLLLIAHSATSLSCSMLGAGLLVSLRVPAIQKRMKHLWLYGAAAAAAVFMLVMLNAGDAMVGAMGRDLTFTGRVDIWNAVLRESINPVVGAGYYSFWMGDRVKRVSEGYYYELNEAHNGYLETYLNSGFIGCFLILAFLVAAAKDIRKELELGVGYAGVRLTILAAGAFHNLTESGFNRLNALWFALLLVAMKYPSRAEEKLPVGALGEARFGNGRPDPSPIPDGQRP